jgi:hypothetical protein
MPARHQIYNVSQACSLQLCEQALRRVLGLGLRRAGIAPGGIMAADKCERFPMPILDSVELCHCHHGDLRTKLMLLVTCVVAGPL